MTKVLVFFDSVEQELSGAQAELFTHAQALGEAAVVLGDDYDLAQLGGFSHAYVASSRVSAPDPALADLIVAAVADFDPDIVLGADTPDSTDALAAAAVQLETGLITQANGVTASGAATKSVLAGSWRSTSQLTREASPLIATMRPNTAEKTQPSGPAPAATTLQTTPSQAVEVIEEAELPQTGRPALTEARAVVAAGRGVDADLSLVEQLADELGGAVGASRAATDAGWIDHSAQIGQTGVTVSPQLYISVGISGAIQQKAGMQTSGTILAVNKDEDAPVFEIADFGVVGDLNDVLPQMIDEIRRRKQ